MKMKFNVKMLSTLAVLLAIVVAGVFSSAVSAQGTGSNPADYQWKFEVTPYYWAPNISGNVEARGFSLPVNLSFSDIKDRMDYGFALNLLATKADTHWGGMMDGIYMYLNGERPLPEFGTTLQGSTRLFELEGAVLYSPQTELQLQQAGGKPIWYAFYTGLRYIGWKTTQTVVSVNSATVDQAWIEPMIGATTKIPVIGNLGLAVRGDVGGFNVGASSFTWDALIDLRYKFSKNQWVNAGYRWFGLDTVDNGTGGKLTFEGPKVGITTVF